ncbi:DUF397 domain-containing protein [Goodfellowiella coeruleoviolacea]|uniref:DUF397 domain-containing protein n=1 Tax=Goodfellowiella coeruleoviolacea TaxID=334858 RepID=A0AAE3GLK6_9PSEU|nr:DUF397 domain-containing protein [Goodfellowiella coeruleoviolacea]MCP2169848.1 protein of unknown function (DUF397) [Goodfellowiella coeruleoviolacea]
MMTACLGNWRRSSYSGSENNCVELAHRQGVTAVRDSKNAGGPALIFGQATLDAFLLAIKNERFDR